MYSVMLRNEKLGKSIHPSHLFIGGLRLLRLCINIFAIRCSVNLSPNVLFENVSFYSVWVQYIGSSPAYSQFQCLT